MNELLKVGSEKGMCAKYRQKILACTDMGQLIEYYKTIPNWCLENKYPSLGYMKGNCISGQGDFYFSSKVSVVASKQVYVFNNCIGQVRTKFIVSDPFFPMIYLGLDCDIILTVDGFQCTVELYDTSSVTVVSKNGGKCIVYQYGIGLVKSDSDFVKVIFKN